MKKEIETKKRGPKAGTRPDMTGVAGELVDAAAVPEGLIWGNRCRVSPYDPLLRTLMEAGPGKMLRFGDARARVSVSARAKRMGMRSTCAEDKNVLYVRFDGAAHIDLKARRREQLLKLLKNGPSSAINLAVRIREQGDPTIDAQMAEAMLDSLVKTGEVVKQEGGRYALNSRRAAAA